MSAAAAPLFALVSCPKLSGDFRGEGYTPWFLWSPSRSNPNPTSVIHAQTSENLLPFLTTGSWRTPLFCSNAGDRVDSRGSAEVYQCWSRSLDWLGSLQRQKLTSLKLPTLATMPTLSIDNQWCVIYNRDTEFYLVPCLLTMKYAPEETMTILTWTNDWNKDRPRGW